jgi:hypothetical protein
MEGACLMRAEPVGQKLQLIPHLLMKTSKLASTCSVLHEAPMEPKDNPGNAEQCATTDIKAIQTMQA